MFIGKSALRQLVVLWLASTAIVASLLAISMWRSGGQWRFFLLVPYPAGVYWFTRGFSAMVSQIFRADPFVGSALCVLAFAILATVWQIARRLSMTIVNLWIVALPALILSATRFLALAQTLSLTNVGV
jgi:hypothetical protein